MHNEQMAKGLGRKSGALLDMLAEVASQKLHSDPAVQPSTTGRPSSRLPSKSKRWWCHGKTGNSTSISVSELQNMSPNYLLKLFADFHGDEMKRTFLYTCRIDTINCNRQFSSFGSENKAREQMKNHLQSHVTQLTAEGSLTKRFETIDSQKRRTNEWKEISVVKKLQRNRKDLFQTKEPDENDGSIPNKKLCSVSAREPLSVQKCTNPDPASRTGKQLSCSIYREHNYTNLNLVTPPEKVEESTVMDAEYALVQVFDDSMAVAQYEEIPVFEHSSSLEQGVVSKPSDDIVLVCCVDDNWVNQLSLYGKDGNGVDPNCLEHHISDDMPVKNIDEHTFKREAVTVNSLEQLEDSMEKKKPKGKAKFIGQSKVEKEMAIAMIESMKRKGNSTECLECRICNPPRVFTAPTTLISHYRSHAGIKPYECRICGSVFTRQHSLNYHMLIHSNKTRFTCSDCGRTFRHPSHFKEHRRRHTGESPYECTDCTVRFKTRNTFKRHMKTRHGKLLTTTGSVIAMSDDESAQLETSSRLEGELQAQKKSPKTKKEGKKLVQKKHNVLKSETLSSIETVIPAEIKQEDCTSHGDVVEQALMQCATSFPSNGTSNSKVKVETVWKEQSLGDSCPSGFYNIVADHIKDESVVQASPLVHTLTATVTSNVEQNEFTERKLNNAPVAADRFNFITPAAEVCQSA